MLPRIKYIMLIKERKDETIAKRREIKLKITSGIKSAVDGKERRIKSIILTIDLGGPYIRTCATYKLA